jgi:hypothetical protein
MTRHPVVAPRWGWRVLSALALCALSATFAACGGDDDDGGAAGAPMVTPTLGDPCVNECTSGLVCSVAGLFPRQCSALCSGVDSCSMLAPGKMTACIGTGSNECGLLCTVDASCPMGTKCLPVAGQMACLAAR